MPTTEKVLQADIAGEERAIRHLIGERKALNSKLHREQAVHKLNEAKLRALTTARHKAVAPKDGGPIPHGARFPDTSVYQAAVDYRAIKDANAERFGALAVTKLTEGTSYVDRYGLARLGLMAGAGIKHRGAYCFGHPSEGGVAQAEHFMEAGGHRLDGADIIIYDCEVTDGERASSVAAAAREFGDYVGHHSPAKVWLYGGGPFLHENGVTLSGYHAHWLAAYTGDPSPYMVFGRAKTIAWQYTDGVHGPTPHAVPGIGTCDVSIIL